MGSDIYAPALERQMLRREAGRWWWTPLIGAVIWFVIAWLVLRADYTSLATVGVILGVAFLIAAVNEGALGAVMGGGWAVWHVVLAVVLVLGAIWAFARPIDTFFALASVLGLLLLLQGVLTLTRGVALRDASPYWWLDVGAGALITLLGIWVSTSGGIWTLGTRAAFILLWVGFMAIFRGISDIAMAFSLRRFSQADERMAWPGGPPLPAAPQRSETPANSAASGNPV